MSDTGPSLPRIPMPFPRMTPFIPAEAGVSELPQPSGSPLPLFLAAKQNPGTTFIPRTEDCRALWDRYGMPQHIRAHSELVADMALALALKASSLGMRVIPEVVYAAGLLHDLGKIHSITHGGDHGQIGASWVMRETRNGIIAQAVLFHVHWPWEGRLQECVENDDHFTAMAVLYSDKRVKHDGWADLDDRYADLTVRYGVTDHARRRIEESRLQGKSVEAALSRRLGVPIHEYTAHRGRLVKRT